MEIHLCFGEHALVVCELRLGLIERRLIGAGVNQEELLAFFDVVTRRELDLFNGPGDPWKHRDAVDRLNIADGIYDLGNIFARSDRGGHRHGRRRRGGGRPRRSIAQHAYADPDEDDDCQAGNDCQAAARPKPFEK